MKKPTALTIEVSAEQLAALRVLCDAGDAQRTLLVLVDRVVDGVTRPGAWERAWLEQAFGDAWQERLEPDPERAVETAPATDQDPACARSMIASYRRTLTRRGFQ